VFIFKCMVPVRPHCFHFHWFTCTTFAGGKPLNHVAEALL
jgi:hypothetical protein